MLRVGRQAQRLSFSRNSEIASDMRSALRFYRVLDWLHFLGFTLLGILLADASGSLSLSRTVMIVAASAGLLAYAYSFNEVFDRELERLHCIRQNSAVSDDSTHALFPAVPLLGSLVLLLQFSWAVLVLGVLFSLLWTTYSYPIPRLKAIPVVGTLVNGIGFPLLFLIGFAAVRAPSFGCLWFFLALVLLGIPAQLIHEVCHSQGDRLLQLHTTAIRYGTRRALQGGILALVCVIMLVAIMLNQGLVDIMTALSIGSFAGLFTLILLFEHRRQDVANFRQLRVKYKYGGILVGIVVVTSFLL
jgi:4-hydroxybenzoate polyprenyltransferase